ncbi:MFS transporter, partial [Acinetobacter nosocomialis]
LAGSRLVDVSLLCEHHRANPLLLPRWLGASSTLRFIFGAFAIRLLMSEQSYAAVNFLKTMGMGPDQFVPLYVVILVGILSGTLFSA